MARPSCRLPRELVGPDTPLRLEVAAALAYPDGSMTASGLRKEVKKGRLVIERTAGKDYVTLAAIEEMRKICRGNASHHASGSSPQNVTPSEGSRITQRGTLRTEAIERAQATARTMLGGP